VATHYWPGEDIGTLPFSETWDSTAWDALPISTSPPYPPADAGEVGYDPNLPGRATSTFTTTRVDGGSPTIFHIVGTGQTVEFFAISGPYGLVMQLFDFDLTSTTGLSNVPAWFKYVQQSNIGDYSKSVGIRVFLVSGKDYYLNVASYSGTAHSGTPGQPGYVSGNGQIYTLSVRVAPSDLNDTRDNAQEIIIAQNGQTYKSPPVLNTDYAVHVGATDDPTGTTMQATAWWRYVPEAATEFQAQAFIDPIGFPTGALTAWRMSGTGAMTQVDTQLNSNPAGVLGTATAGETIYFQVGIMTGGYVSYGHRYSLWVTGGRTVAQVPANPDPSPLLSPNIPVPDKYVPDAMAPASVPASVPAGTGTGLDTGSATLLELVRAFSAAVHRPVRIINPTTIELVDLSDPLPLGWADTDAASMYTTTVRSAAASAGVLSIRVGDVKVEASAQVKADDMRIPLSSWRIPNRLPVYGLPSAPVQQITYTFSPTGFTASVDFHFLDVPIEARRI
jgi:hypothetical protein